MEGQEYREYLLSHIRPWAKLASGNRMINCRCFYCRDSRNQNHGHFYISIPQSYKELSLFYCQKCKVGGVVTQSKLLEWQLFDADIGVSLTTHNKVAFNLPENKVYKDSEVYRIYNDTINRDSLSTFKLKYINDRLGCDLTFDDCLRLKIVLNIQDLLTRNNLSPSRDPRIIEALDSGFLGFLSIDNAFLNLRNLDIVKDLHMSIDKRYTNYNIFGKYDNTRRFYTIPAEINLQDPRPIELHLAEGPFDILSIYLRYTGDKSRCIFSSIGGSGYIGLVRQFILMIKVPNLIIHIYPDNDVSRDQMIYIAELLKVFKYQIYIHRNLYPGTKDFGVRPECIDERVEKILI